MKLTYKVTDFKYRFGYNGGKPNWCPGCGNYGIITAIRRALVEVELDPKDVVLIGGIGCSGKLPQWVVSYGFHALHGRTLPVASGIKLANRDLTVIAHAGDGDCYGIGIGHLIHTMRRNLDIVCIVHNNQIYGLTTGQTSPTSLKGFKSKSTPEGVIELPINPIALALSSDATFVARGYAGENRHLTELVVEAVKHRGFALLDTLQPCVTFNRVNTYDWFKERVYKLEETGHDFTDKNAAFDKAFEWAKTNSEKIPIGIFYKEERPPYGDEIPHIVEKSLVKHDITNIDIEEVLNMMI